MILVAGATGTLGGRIARSLLARGKSLRVLARRAAQADALRAAGAAVATADLTDAASLGRACQGVDTIITTASVSKRGGDTIDHVDLHGNFNLIEAASQCGVRHLIFTSTLGASDRSPVPLFRVKAAVEARLRASGLDWTVLHPDAFMDVWFGMLIERPLFSGAPVTLVGEASRRHAFVAEQDVAAFAVAAVDHPAARNATIPIGGPEAVSLREVVRMYAVAAGREIPIRRVAPFEPIPGLPGEVSGLVAALETFDSPVPMDETARSYGVTLTSAAEFARARVAAVAG